MAASTAYACRRSESVFVCSCSNARASSRFNAPSSQTRALAVTVGGPAWPVSRAAHPRTAVAPWRPGGILFARHAHTLTGRSVGNPYLYGGVGVVLLVVLGAITIRIVRDYERAIVFRLGRVLRAKGPGMVFLIPAIDRMVRVTLRVQTYDVAPQDIITSDTVSVKVNGVLMFRVVDPSQAVIGVEDYISATGLLAQTTLRAVLSGAELDALLVDRESLNSRLQETIATQAAQWGVEVLSMEVKHVDLPDGMRRAMARQAEADRERQAKIVAADGEFEAATALRDAAEILERNPGSVQLRYLQTLVEIASEQHSSLIFPIPIDVLSAFEDVAGGAPAE
ncbi:slipin family protein [Candidatus Poribacteria bacterium]|nr:slipin family protein [Candidatus Poribacteria bacterium]MBT5714982.1 slipin family protein [Candidatus Poribacteria bacterium]MBT7099607.1 slipin family protein [Candidatus Poribacteria bacterium]MBT7806922.1 slipin family protein [Candidatus Poribacteria bacterium]